MSDDTKKRTEADKNRESLQILSIEIGGMLNACNHILKVTTSLSQRLVEITRKIENGNFYTSD